MVTAQNVVVGRGGAQIGSAAKRGTFVGVHPIERLRAVARADGVPQDRLVAEAAMALSAFSSQPAAMLTAARQVVARQVTAGGMWWLAARMLGADDPWSAAGDVLDAIEADATTAGLEYALGEFGSVVVDAWSPTVVSVLLGETEPVAEVVDVDGRGDRLVQQLHARGVEVRHFGASAPGPADPSLPPGPYVAECAAMSPSAALVARGAGVSVDEAASAGREIWIVGGVGRLLPDEMFDALVARADAEGALDAEELEVLELDRVDRVVGPRGERRVHALARDVDCPVAPELYRAPRG